MKSLPLISGLCFLLFSACGNNDTSNTSENDVDAARNFIRAALDGQYKEAQNLIVTDSVNLQYLDAFASNYRERMSGEDKRGYRESSINIHDIQSVNDSVTIVHYSNSYKKEPESLKVVHRDNNWLVDLKYSFASVDTTQKQ
jgi:type IV secretory pathway component VirB8